MSAFLTCIFLVAIVYVAIKVSKEMCDEIDREHSWKYFQNGNWSGREIRDKELQSNKP